MADEDDFLTGWIDQATTMQDCMANCNTDTSADLKVFLRQTHASLILSDAIKEQFRSCFFDKTQLAIPDSALASASTFRDLLDACFRPLAIAVMVVMRAVALEHNPALPSNNSFGAVAAKTAFPDEIIAEITGRLAEDMPSLFTGGPVGQQTLKTLIAKANATAQSVAQGVV